jgi:hypothetical protein
MQFKKYRDTLTGEVWSAQGRPCTWVKPGGAARYAAQYQTGGGNNGIANAFDAPGLTVIADPSYPNTERLSGWLQGWPQPLSHFIDQRQGSQLDIYRDPPKNYYSSANDFHVDGCTLNTLQGYVGGQTGWVGSKTACHNITFWYGMPGIDLGNGAPGPGGWSQFAGLLVGGNVNSPGIMNLIGGSYTHAGIGDGTGLYLYHYNYGGAVAGSDEGNNLISTLGGEAGTTYAGAITSGGTGATSIKVNCTKDCNAAGDGRYVIDLSRGVSGNATAHTNPSGFTPGTFATDISVTPSSFWGALNADVKTPTAPTGGTPGVTPTPMTFTVNSGNGNKGSPQVGDLVCFAGSFHEQAKITAVSGTGPWTVTVPLRHAHEASSWMMANGPCGSFIDFTANDVAGTGQTLRYPVDIVGATDAHTLNYRYFRAHGNTSYFAGNVQWAQSAGGSLSNTGGVVTFSNFWSSNEPWLFNVPTITISSATNPAFNGACKSTVANAEGQLTCTQASSAGQNSSTATVAVGASQYGNTVFNLYPGAELLDVQDYSAANCAAAGKIAPCMDGALTLEPNHVAWTSGDNVENSHHYASLQGAKHDTLTQYNPIEFGTYGELLTLLGTGVGGGNVTAPTANFAAKAITNLVAASNYVYHGGYRTPPGGFALGGGLFNYGLDMGYAPDPVGSNVIYVGCPYSGCNDAAFNYYLFSLGGNGGSTQLTYTPNARGLALNAGSLDLNHAPLLQPTIKSRANGSVAQLTMSGVDGAGTPHNWNIQAPITGGGYTLTLPQKTGTIATTADTPVGASLTTSDGSSDNVKMGGVTTTSHCALTATNPSAAANIATVYISAKAAGSVTVTHAAKAGMTFDLLCTSN